MFSPLMHITRDTRDSPGFCSVSCSVSERSHSFRWNATGKTGQVAEIESGSTYRDCYAIFSPCTAIEAAPN